MNRAESDNRSKGSMRRLGSFAHINLNPFSSRRRSQLPDAAMIAATNSALSVPAVPSVVSSRQTSTVNLISPAPDCALPMQPKPTFSSRRRSYIPVPEDTCHVLPRSRTLSNLPLPAKVKGPLSMSKSKSIMMLPPSRLPTPTRIDTKNRLSIGTKAVLKPNKHKSLQRSDTEPLLSVASDSSTFQNAPRTTVFKENLSLSPIKSKADIHMFEDSLPSSDAMPHVSRQPSWYLQQSLGPRKTPVAATSVPASGAQSSPIKKAISRKPTTPEKLARGRSQPVLAHRSHNVPTKKASYSADIKQHKLLTPRQPPMPPPPAAPSKRTTPAKQQSIGTDHTYQLGSNREDSTCSDHSTPSPMALNPDEVSGISNAS